MLRVAAAAAAAHAARHAPAASSRGIFALCAPRRAADRRFASRLTRPPPAAQDGAGGRQPGVRGTRGAAAAAAAACAWRCFAHASAALTLPSHCTRSHTAFTRSGTLVGEDSFGNKYYENMAYQAGARGGCIGRNARGAPITGAPRATADACARRRPPPLGGVRRRAELQRAQRAARVARCAPLLRLCIAARSLSASPHARTLLPPRAGWLHQVTDAAPTRVAQYHPPYEVPALSGGYGNTGFGQATSMAPSHEVHFPKGHLKASPGRKSWTRFTEWKPPAAK